MQIILSEEEVQEIIKSWAVRCGYEVSKVSIYHPGGTDQGGMFSVTTTNTTPIKKPTTKKSSPTDED